MRSGDRMDASDTSPGAEALDLTAAGRSVCDAGTVGWTESLAQRSDASSATNSGLPPVLSQVTGETGASPITRSIDGVVNQ